MDAPRARSSLRRRTGWALALAGTIFILAGLAAPDALQHLRPSAQDFHSCSIYHWAHGASASAPSCPALDAALPVAPAASAPPSGAAPDVAAPPAASRAPPAIA